jgi:hypothetical protein
MELSEAIARVVVELRLSTCSSSGLDEKDVLVGQASYSEGPEMVSVQNNKVIRMLYEATGKRSSAGAIKEMVALGTSLKN